MNIQSYAELGWSFFPVKGPHYGSDHADSKTPFKAFSWKPFQSRKPTSQEITQWQQNMPKMSIGVPTGPINNFIVIDIDSNDWMLQFPDADFGITWKSKSTRGCHFFYQWEDWMLDIPSTGSAIGDLKGFDLRGQGGYVVVPNDNDPVRSWEIHPADQPLAKMPHWIKTFLLSSLSKTKQKKTPDLSEITEGNRHNKFLSYAGKLHHYGFERSEISDFLTPLAEKVGFGNEIGPLISDVVARYPINRREKLRPESMKVLLSESEPPLEWMIEGLWTDKSRGFIAGNPGIGKTWIALDMLLSVATGGLCMGKYRAVYQAPCLLIEEESSRLNLQRRIHALARARGLQPQDLSSLYHITRQFANIPRDGEEIAEIVRSKGIRFIVFDSLRAVHSAKENSSDEMAVILQSFAQIAEAGKCSLILIHHLSKSSPESSGKSIFERMRGTGSLWAWRDCILGVEGEEESDVSTCSFQFRDAESPNPVQIKRHVGETTGAIALEVFDASESPEFLLKSKAAIAHINANFGAVLLTDIAKALEGRKQDNLKAVKLMLKKGILVPVEAGKIGVPV